jgi:hypothetical protein
MRPPATPDFKVGDKVAYSVQFLKSIGMSHGDIARGRGVITGIVQPCVDWKLAVIAWDKGADLPTKVNVHNLALVGPNRRFANCD